MSSENSYFKLSNARNLLVFISTSFEDIFTFFGKNI